jgi:hypothetical protein
MNITKNADGTFTVTMTTGEFLEAQCALARQANTECRVWARFKQTPKKSTKAYDKMRSAYDSMRTSSKMATDMADAFVG